MLETRLDTILPTLATKDDIRKLEADMVKWGVGLALGIVGLIVGYLSLTRPSQPGVQPIVIQIPAVTPAPVAQAPASMPLKPTP